VTLVYALSAVVLTVGLGLSLNFSLGQANLDVIGNFYVIVKSFALVVRFAVIAYAFFGSVKCNDKRKKKLIQTLSLYYFIAFAINSLILEYIPISANILFYLSPLIYVFINIPPLFFLQKYAKMIFKDRLLAQEDKINFEGIFQKYGLSKREQEIFILMLEGKSNKEIGEDLFISVKTVKNHIYSIFQKLGVNSRIKLYVFIRNLANSQ
jgi:DNA-binding CsgD family transcriptional regulator